MGEHWTWRERAAFKWPPNIKHLGEDEDGNLFVPSKTRPGWWDRKFNPYNPTHWPYWLRSRLALRLVMLESEPIDE